MRLFAFESIEESLVEHPARIPRQRVENFLRPGAREQPLDDRRILRRQHAVERMAVVGGLSPRRVREVERVRGCAALQRRGQRDMAQIVGACDLRGTKNRLSFALEDAQRSEAGPATFRES